MTYWEETSRTSLFQAPDLSHIEKGEFDERREKKGPFANGALLGLISLAGY